MSNPTVSFRISDFHLARGLRAIRQLEPAWNITSCSDLIRTIFNDYIAKSEFHHSIPLDVSPELIAEIMHIRHQVKQAPTQKPLPMLGDATIESSSKLTQLEIDQYNAVKAEVAVSQKQTNQSLNDIQTLAGMQAPNNNNPLTSDQPTESDINTVTDFSLPPELRNKLVNKD